MPMVMGLELKMSTSTTAHLVSASPTPNNDANPHSPTNRFVMRLTMTVMVRSTRKLDLVCRLDGDQVGDEWVCLQKRAAEGYA